MSLSILSAKVHPRSYTIPPFGSVDIGEGAGTIALVGCEAMAIQLVSDDRAYRLENGASLPFSGVQRAIRNPFSRSITAQVLISEKLAIDANPQLPANPNLVQFSWAQRSVHTYKQSAASGAGLKWGVMFMAERSRYFIEGVTLGTAKSAIVPRAKLEYLALKGGTYLTGTETAYHMHGLENPDIVSISGTYSDSDIAAWIAAANWEGSPVEIRADNGAHQLHFGPDTAVIIYGDENAAFECNSKIWEEGSWDHRDTVYYGG